MEGSDNGYYKLSWGERIGFNSGELAQNLIYQTISIWLLFYYNNVFGLDAGEEYIASVQYVKELIT